MLCSKAKPVAIAVCVHGAARSFTHVLVHRSQKENLIDPLGPHVTVFAHITLGDARGTPDKRELGTFLAASEAKVQDVARFLGARERNVKILEGTSAELPRCENYAENYAARKNATKVVQSMVHIYSLAGQLSHREGCMSLIRDEEENRKDGEFHAVVLVRTDLTVYTQFKPFCMYNFAWPRRFHDWFWMVPRAAADVIFSKPYDQFYGCRKGLDMRDNVEKYVLKFSQGAIWDVSLPIMVARMNAPGFSTGFSCSRFTSPGRLTFDPTPVKQLCEPMTTKNKFNKEAGIVYAGTEVAQPPSISRVLCADFRVPTLAVCLHGPARTFEQPLVYRSQKEHLVDALGAEATVFLHITAGSSASAASAEAMRYLGVDADRVLAQQHREWDLPLCAAKWHKQNTGTKLAAALRRSADRLRSLHACMGMIRREESRRASNFDVVVTARADVIFYAALKPFCMYNLAQPRRLGDWLYLVPRGLADSFTAEYEAFRTCSQECSPSQQSGAGAGEAPYRCGEIPIWGGKRPRFANGRETTRGDVCSHDSAGFLSLTQWFSEDGSLPAVPSHGSEVAVDMCGAFNNVCALDFDPEPRELCESMMAAASGGEPR